MTSDTNRKILKIKILSDIRFISLFISFILSGAVYAQLNEYDVKAMFIKKMLIFIDYPNEVRNKTTYMLGIIGENPFETQFEKLSANNKKGEKGIEVKTISNLNEIDSCDLLFIARSEKKRLSQILSRTKGKPILTMGDSEGFAAKGVHVNFYIENKKLHFEINHEAVKETGIYMSYHLLNHAKIIK